jgi:hypothetical protein
MTVYLTAKFGRCDAKSFSFKYLRMAETIERE